MCKQNRRFVAFFFQMNLPTKKKRFHYKNRTELLERVADISKKRLKKRQQHEQYQQK